MNQDLEKLKHEMSALAERIASEVYGIELDYSTESIKQVEKILGRLHKEYKKTKSDEGYAGIAFEFAA
jgi:replicative DNA helicase